LANGGRFSAFFIAVKKMIMLTLCFLVFRFIPSINKNKMSSSLITLVPILTGPNYQSWALLMKSFLMSQGLWRILTKICPATPRAEDKDIKTILKAIEEWEETNLKAVGTIGLRLHHTLQYRYRSKVNARELWDALMEEYGKPGVVATYLEFKAVMETRISDNADPSPAVDKITAHFARLEDSGVTIPEHLQVMILMSKLPSTMDQLVQIFCQAEDVKKLRLDKLRWAIVLAWEQGKTQRQPQQAQHVEYPV
jgi:hypothetical protein